MKGGDLFERQLRQDFEEFLLIYPRKRAPERAWKPYVLARQIVNKETLHKSAAKFAECCRGREIQFIPYPCNWLRDHSWRDADEAETSVPVDPNLESRLRIKSFKEHGIWLPYWGERPDDPRCREPIEVLREFGYRAVH